MDIRKLYKVILLKILMAKPTKTQLDLTKLIKNSEKKPEEKKEEQDATPIPQFTSSLSDLSREISLDTTIKEDSTKKQNLEKTAREAPKKEEKEETKKVYEGVYQQDNQLYKNQAKNEPEVRINTHFVSRIEATSIDFSQPISPHPKSIGMVREDRFSQNSQSDSPERRYELTRKPESSNSNPFSPEMEIKERKYKI